MSYMDRLLWVDLTRGTVRKTRIPEEWRVCYLGGRGFTSRALYELVDADTDPLSPGNILTIATGPLDGTLSPSSGRFTVGCRSPLTGLLGDANSGGHFAPELRYAGYDAIIVRGRAKSPAYLFIDDDHVELRDASCLWGRGVFDTVGLLEQQHGKDIKVIAIGQAGEHLVPYANIMAAGHNAAGRTGVGAVMGSKNLKAIAVRGSGDIPVADDEGFLAKVRECHKKLIADPTYETFSEYGTLTLVNIAQAAGGLSTRNAQFGLFEHYENISSHVYQDTYKLASKACFSCILHCKNYARVTEPPYECEDMGPEYETMVTLGSRVGVGSLPAILKANHLANDYGIDTISAGTSIAFLMECSQRGLIDEKYEWGDADFVIDCLHKIARREGLGEFLAKGVRAMSAEIPGSEGFALHVKGLELPAFDVRTGKGFALGEAVASRGGDHLRALPNFELLSKTKDEGIRRFGTPDCVNPYIEDGKVGMVIWHENYGGVCDSAEICKYCTFQTYAIMPQDVADLLTCATGRPYSEAELLTIGERIINIERVFNLRCGMVPREDNLPRRFLEEGLPEGPAEGMTVNLSKMLPDYYAGRGWTKDGVPAREKLEMLGIAEKGVA
ncbi:MAG: aldehyde ferredoxin oxidoreductase family protein [Bacillota bacterium]